MNRRRGFAKFMAYALALALAGALLGGTVVLINVWWQPDLVITTTAQATVVDLPPVARKQSARSGSWSNGTNAELDLACNTPNDGQQVEPALAEPADVQMREGSHPTVDASGRAPTGP